jgi:hypothetical protein
VCAQSSKVFAEQNIIVLLKEAKLLLCSKSTVSAARS